MKNFLLTGWLVLRQLVVLAIFVLLLLAFPTEFERAVIALLGMVYSALSSLTLRQAYLEREGRLLQSKQFLHLSKALDDHGEEITIFEETLRDDLSKFQEQGSQYLVAVVGSWLIWVLGALALLEVLFFR